MNEMAGDDEKKIQTSMLEAVRTCNEARNTTFHSHSKHGHLFHPLKV
jgi:hypothetical protein